MVRMHIVSVSVCTDGVRVVMVGVRGDSSPAGEVKLGQI